MSESQETVSDASAASAIATAEASVPKVMRSGKLSRDAVKRKVQRKPALPSAAPNVNVESGIAGPEASAPEMPQTGIDFRRAVKDRTARLPDYDDENVKERWKKLIDRQREELQSDVLQIAKPRAKLDPIAKTALDGLLDRLIRCDPHLKHLGQGQSATPDNVERFVRTRVVENGIASEAKRVTQRLNARRMTDGRRWVLSATYVLLLARLFLDKGEAIEDVMEDDLGVAEKILLDLEAENGPIDTFTKLIVNDVMERNRISESRTLLELVSQQVRSAI